MFVLCQQNLLPKFRVFWTYPGTTKLEKKRNHILLYDKMFSKVRCFINSFPLYSTVFFETSYSFCHTKLLKNLSQEQTNQNWPGSFFKSVLYLRTHLHSQHEHLRTHKQLLQILTVTLCVLNKLKLLLSSKPWKTNDQAQTKTEPKIVVEEFGLKRYFFLLIIT